MASDGLFLLLASLRIGALLPLIGCQQAAQISIEQGPTGVAFAVEGGGEPNCIISLSVRTADDRAEPPIWAISEGENGACASKIDYARTPPRYIQTSPPRDLVANVRYDVTAVGVGFNVRETFTVR